MCFRTNAAKVASGQFCTYSAQEFLITLCRPPTHGSRREPYRTKKSARCCLQKWRGVVHSYLFMVWRSCSGAMRFHRQGKGVPGN